MFSIQGQLFVDEWYLVSTLFPNFMNLRKFIKGLIKCNKASGTSLLWCSVVCAQASRLIASASPMRGVLPISIIVIPALGILVNLLISISISITPFRGKPLLARLDLFSENLRGKVTGLANSLGGVHHCHQHPSAQRKYLTTTEIEGKLSPDTS